MNVKLFVFKWLESRQVGAVKGAEEVRGAGFHRPAARGRLPLPFRRAGRPGAAAPTAGAARPALSGAQPAFAA